MVYAIRDVLKRAQEEVTPLKYQAITYGDNVVAVRRGGWEKIGYLEIGVGEKGKPKVIARQGERFDPQKDQPAFTKLEEIAKEFNKQGSEVGVQEPKTQ